MIPLTDKPENRLLLLWLAEAGIQVPAVLAPWELDAYTLLASPDLVGRMLELADAGLCVAVHGFPALVGDDGVVDVVCAGLSTLIVRSEEEPDGLVLTDAAPPPGWVAVDAWLAVGRPDEGDALLAELIRAARLR